MFIAVHVNHANFDEAVAFQPVALADKKMHIIDNFLVAYTSAA